VYSGWSNDTFTYDCAPRLYTSSGSTFYLKYGFVELTDDTKHLCISMKSVQKLFP